MAFKLDLSEWNRFRANIRNVENFLDNDLPDIVGTESVNFFQENFQNEGFTDRVNEPWEEVKRRTDPRTRGARAIRKILSGDTGDLGESIEYKKTAADTVSVTSDKEYSDAHNEGTTDAGRNHNVTIPKRQFIGPSEKLFGIIEDKIRGAWSRVFGR